MGALISPLPPPPAVVAPDSKGICLTFDDAYGSAPLMVVRSDVASGRVRLQDQAKPCPAHVACAFVRKAYILPGDTVLASAPLNGYRCIYVGARGSLSAGFVPEEALKPSSAEGASITPSFLAGRWRDADDDLVFKVKGASVSVVGSAYWPGRKPAYRPDGSEISIHTGDVDGNVRLEGPRFDVGDDQDCHVWGWRRGPYLVVEDNSGCGGANVRFLGVYVKAGA